MLLRANNIINIRGLEMGGKHLSSFQKREEDVTTDNHLLGKSTLSQRIIADAGSLCVTKIEKQQ
jgi:hypothetical protein